MAEELKDVLKTGPTETREILPEEVRLANGSPIIDVFLPDNLLVMPHDVHEAASEELRGVIMADRKAVLACQGLTLEEARAKLKPIAEKNRTNVMGEAA